MSEYFDYCPECDRKTMSATCPVCGMLICADCRQCLGCEIDAINAEDPL